MMEKLSCRLSRICEHEHVLTLRFNRASHGRMVHGLFSLASRLGNGVFWYVLMGLLLLRYQMDALPAVLHMVLVGLISLLLYKWLKGKTRRQRPYAFNDEIRVTVAPLDQFSFPSGHTLHAVSFTIVLLAYYPLMAWLVVPFTLLVALSRLVLGLHYPTDVMAGTLIGAAVASLSFAIPL